MSKNSSPLEEKLFALALEKETADARSAFLDESCLNRPELRKRLELLLKGHFEAVGFLTEEPPHLQEFHNSRNDAELPAQKVGRYKLLEKIGEGGFGEVWMAEQREPVKRRVALKIIKLGMDSRQVVARFEAERQALALMDHPNIARIFDADVAENGRPYFIMELVKGIRITDYCDRHQLSTHERLELFILVCSAIQHAHQKGVIHRDIKPSNILVTLHDGVPVPKVIDFGIAKATQGELTDKTMFTQFQQFIGTPAYISPEQAEMSGLDVDTRSDIYSLGVLLYELLVGRTPFDSKEMLKDGLDGLRRMIREKDPRRPSTRLTQELETARTKTRGAGQVLAIPTPEEAAAEAQRCRRLKEQLALVQGDLDWIVMKCLEKNRARRYESASGLAMDVQRFLKDEPVIARAPSPGYLIEKLIRRNKWALLASTGLLVVLFIGLGAVMLVQYRANQHYRQQLYVSEVNRAATAWQGGQAQQMRALLEGCPDDLRGWEWLFLHQQLDRWVSTPVLSVSQPADVGISDGGERMAVYEEGAIQYRAALTGQSILSVPFTAQKEHTMALAPRGDLLAMAETLSGRITVWEMQAGKRIAEMHHPSVRLLTWMNDGRHLASVGGDSQVRIWDAEKARWERSYSVTPTPSALAFSPDDRTMAIGTIEKVIQLINTSDGSVVRRLQTRGPFLRLLKFSPDGRLLAAANSTAGGYGRDHRVWDLEDGGSLDLNSGAEALSFSFSNDSKRLVIGDDAGKIQIWDLEHRARMEHFSAHLERVTWVHQMHDGRILSTGGDDLVKLWKVRGAGITQLRDYPNSLRQVAFSQDSRWLAAGGLAWSVPIWNAAECTLAGSYTNHSLNAHAIAFGPEGLMASASSDLTVQLWDRETKRAKWVRSLAPAVTPYWIAFSPDGRRIYAPSHLDTLSVLDARTGKIVNSIHGLKDIQDGLSISPDGHLLALGQKERLSVRRSDDLSELWHRPTKVQRCVTFSPDGNWIATGDDDGQVSLWEVASEGRVHRRLAGHTAPVTGVGFHPDGIRLVSSSRDGLVKVWNWKLGLELLTLPLPGGGGVWHTTFSPDGKSIAAAGGDGIVTLWRIE